VRGPGTTTISSATARPLVAIRSGGTGEAHDNSARSKTETKKHGISSVVRAALHCPDWLHASLRTSKKVKARPANVSEQSRREPRGNTPERGIRLEQSRGGHHARSQNGCGKRNGGREPIRASPRTVHVQVPTTSSSRHPERRPHACCQAMSASLSASGKAPGQSRQTEARQQGSIAGRL